EAKVTAGLQALGIEETERARYVRVARYVLGLEPGGPGTHVDPEQLKRQIFVAMRTLFERRLAHGPLLLVLEDLHWADAASVELLSFLADRLADRRLLLVVTHRPGLDMDIEAVVGVRAPHTAIRLGALPTGAGAALVAALFGPSAAGLPGALRDL